MTDETQAAQQPPPPQPAQATPRESWLRRLDQRVIRLTAWWRTQHTLRFVLGGIVMIAATIGVPTTVLSLWQYYAEAPQREGERALRRLEVLNSAWERIRDTHGKVGDFGQVGAVAILLAHDKRSLKNASLSGIDFSGADFSYADLRGANFGDGRAIGTKFVGAVIRGTTLRGMRLADVDLDSVAVVDAKLDFSASRLRNVILPKMPMEPILDIRRATLVAVNLSSYRNAWIVADGACLAVMDFSNHERRERKSEIPSLQYTTDLSFRNARLAGVSFRNADLSAADFREAVAIIAQTSGPWHFARYDSWAGLPGSECQNYQEIILDEGRLTDKKRISIDELSAPDYIFGAANDPLVGTPTIDPLAGTGFVPMQWRTHFTDFSGARMLGARLEGADFHYGRGLTQSQIDSACIDARTRLPQGLRWNGRACVLATAAPKAAADR